MNYVLIAKKAVFYRLTCITDLFFYTELLQKFATIYLNYWGCFTGGYDFYLLFTGVY
ncbi:hypothetical protein NIES4071_27610 [Calothrix sp. NIES-4071]|nr:hypothetical protein NIES4071_27610 [Calothrix sp. NIES-4071]BAZ57083.1 hypothetical protein NIES4105_27550 [Calothrix sp. NIES-4105]